MFLIDMTLSFDHNSNAAVTMDSDGNLIGDEVPISRFDGTSVIVASGDFQDESWRKVGYWNLGFVMKVIITMAVIGIETMIAALAFPPGAIWLGSDRRPLNAVFLVDCSNSITGDMWEGIRQANLEFVADLAAVYAPKRPPWVQWWMVGDPITYWSRGMAFQEETSQLNIGFVQFATTAHVIAPVTPIVDAHGYPTELMANLTDTLNRTEQKGGIMTKFDKALELCQEELDGFTLGLKTFDICVIITDGEDNSFRSTAELKSLLHNDTGVFGIFVGQDEAGSTKMQDLVGCGEVDDTCDSTLTSDDFFVASSNFSALHESTYNVAELMSADEDLYECGMIDMEAGFLFAGLLMLPLIIWWTWGTAVTTAKRREAQKLSQRDAILGDNSRGERLVK
jgi:hypothetical protein